MTDITADRTLAEVVTADPAATRVFEAFGLDYCCRGRRPIGEACATAGVELDAVLDALGALGPAQDVDWASMGAAELAAHIEATHHAYLHTELGRLSALVEKVIGAHGTRHPELEEIGTVYGSLRTELEPHLAKEEQVLFPLIRAFEDATGPPVSPGGSVRNPITVLMAEHDRAGEALATLRALTDGYRPPADGCASYRALYDGLARLESDTHLHVHKENNVLFPAVVALEQHRTSAS